MAAQTPVRVLSSTIVAAIPGATCHGAALPQSRGLSGPYGRPGGAGPAAATARRSQRLPIQAWQVQAACHG